MESSDAFRRAERRLENWALERRQQDREYEAFREQLFRIHSTRSDDGATATVFHGVRQLTRRERLLADHRREAELELRRQFHRQALAVRRRGERVLCRHCGRVVTSLDNKRKCERCRNDPDLITARGKQKRTFVPRPEAQPNVTPLSDAASRVEALMHELTPRERDVLEHRYLRKESDLTAARVLRMTVRVFAGIASAAVAQIARGLETDEYARV